jgi:hypothetical protein
MDGVHRADRETLQLDQEASADNQGNRAGKADQTQRLPVPGSFG